MFRTLVSTDVLSARLPDPAWLIVDCRYKLDDEGWGEREYVARHIPGAAYAHLGHDLAGPRTGTNGRHPLPDPDTLSETLGRLGVAEDIQVVAYDQDNGMYASRLWWLARWMGHEAVAVLDGGLAKWLAEGRPTISGSERHAPREFAGHPRDADLVDATRVASLIGSADWRLVDARAPERFRGDVEPIDKVGGHIPGATNHFFQWNLDEGGTFRSPEPLRERIRQSLAARGARDDIPADRLVCYCGSGVTACHNLLALEHAGLTGAKLYPGSWSEWSADPARPREKG
jgi:thiosulfate/3-mercaptopyruvate sulfurtransferase